MDQYTRSGHLQEQGGEPGPSGPSWPDETSCLSLRELRKALEEAQDVQTAKDLLLANIEVGVGRAHRSMGPRAVCALITQLGRAKQCDKVRRLCSMGLAWEQRVWAAISFQQPSIQRQPAAEPAAAAAAGRRQTYGSPCVLQHLNPGPDEASGSPRVFLPP
jgi:hypothetical protein